MIGIIGSGEPQRHSFGTGVLVCTGFWKISFEVSQMYRRLLGAMGGVWGVLVVCMQFLVTFSAWLGIRAELLWQTP